ncbi:MAG: hypothetical protein HZA90_24055 [Verrucomicrobia bacterium]|nr:hypothetical protein [Verrucomicrobiota bacterium]
MKTQHRVSAPASLLRGLWPLLLATTTWAAPSSVVELAFPAAPPQGQPKDYTPIALSFARTRGNPNRVEVVFTAPVAAASATNRAHYTISPPVTVQSAAVGDDGFTVWLTTAAIGDAGLHTLTVNNVTDTSDPPNAVAANSQTPILKAQGVVTRKIFSGITGATVDALTGHAKFPNAPDFVDWQAGLESPAFGDNYGVQLAGYLYPPLSGDYIFYLASDGQGQLRLSTDESAANKQLIATVATSSGARDYNASASQASAFLRLEAGRRYYIEALMKESTGADHLAVTWLMRGMPGPFDGDPPIPGAFLSSLTPSAPAVVSVPPQSLTVSDGQTATFGVVAGGTPPYTYQWYRNGSPLPLVTGTNFTISAATLADNASAFQVVVANAFSATTSIVATLTVLADPVPPAIVRVSSGPTLDRVSVSFSEPVTAESATTTTNYSLSGSAAVLSARLMPNRTNVILNTSPQTPGQVYALTVRGVADTSSAHNPANTTANFTAWVESRGFLRRELFLGIPGAAVADLSSTVEFPDSPDSASYVMHAEAPNNAADNYGQRLVGLLLPPVTGNYRFYISSDAQGALYLGTDDTPTDLRLLATEPQYDTGPRDWVGTTRRTAANPENRSAPVYLVAGQKYFFEAVMKADTGDDNLGVTWQLPGESVPANGAAPILANFLASFADPTTASLSITQQPASLTVNESSATTFVVGVTSSFSPVFFQWQRNGADLPSATNASYTTPRLLRTDSGASFRCLVSIPGAMATSVNAVVTVTPDNTPPQLLSAGMLAHSGTVGVCFNELLDAASATNPAHYALSSASVLGVTLHPSGQSVLLSISLLLHSNLTLTVNGVKDFAGNLLPANSTATVEYWPMETLDVGTPGTDPREDGLALPCRAGDVTVTAGGSDIGGTKDAFHFVYEMRDGDFDARVRVASLELSQFYAKAGLMAREDLIPGSRHVFAGVQPAGGANRYLALWRLATNGASALWPGVSTNNGVPFPNAWLRLTRTGAVFTAFRGTNGFDWTQFAQATNNTFPSRAFVGLATTAFTNAVGRTTTAAYRSYQASPPGLAPTRLDLLVKRSVEPAPSFALENVYQTVAAGAQNPSQLATPSAPASFDVQIQNDGPSTLSPILRSLESSNAGWDVIYRSGASDITAFVLSTNGYTLSNLIAGASEVVTVEIRPLALVLGGRRESATLSLFADRFNPVARDVVRLTAINDPTYQPDMLVRRLTDVVYAGEDIYNATGLNQTKAAIVEPLTTAIFHLRLVNDGNLTNQFRLTGAGAGPGWTVRFLDSLAGGADITADVMGGNLFVLLPPNGSWNCRLDMTPGLNVPRDTSLAVTLTATALGSPSRSDTVRAITHVQTLSTNPVGRTFTSDADFEEGQRIGTVYRADQLELATQPVTLPFIFVPNSNEGTVSKVDTVTGRELGRYRVGSGTSSNPSRTTVDQFGSCYVANRHYGTVVKIGLLEAGQYFDRNGNGVPDTSFDANGDGDITGSEILPWGQDECVLYEVVIIPGKEGTFTPGTFTGSYGSYNSAGARSIAADHDGNVWAGNYTAKHYYLIEGGTGQILRTNDLTALGHTPYGAVVDANGILWSSELSSDVVWLDPVSNTASNLAIGHTTYGLGLDRNGQLFISGWQATRLSRVNVNTKTKDWTVVGVNESRGVVVTDDGDVWTGNSAPGTVTRWSNDGVIKQHIPVGDTPTGVAVDADGKVWVVDLGDEYIHRIDPALNLVDLSKRLIGTTHYGYSDMTGFVGRNSTIRFGTWLMLHDSRRPFTQWGVVTWHGDEPSANSLRIRVRSSEDGRLWAPWESATNGFPLLATPPGRRLEIEVTLRSTVGGVSPTLYDLTVTPLPQATSEVAVACAALPNPTTNEHLTIFAFAVTNAGPNAARSVVLTSLLPETVPMRSFVLSQGTVSQSGGLLTCLLGSLPAGSNASLVIVTRPTNAVPITNLCAVTHYEKDPALENNAAGQIVNVLPNVCVPPPGDLFHWWPGEGDARDIVRTNHGAILGTLVFADGRVGQAFTFDSNDDRVTVPHHTNFNITAPGFTVEFWLRASNRQPQAYYLAVDKSHGYVDSAGWAFQGMTNTGFLSFIIGAGGSGSGNFVSATSTNTLLDNQWHHVAGTWEAGVIRLYIDGLPHGSNFLATPVHNTRPLNMGYAWGNTTPQRFLRGSVDEVSLYHRALSATEIFALSDALGAGKCREGFAPRIGVEASGGDNFVLSWPAAATGFTLETAPSVLGPWTNSTVTPQPAGNQLVVPIDPRTSPQFFRLKRGP